MKDETSPNPYQAQAKILLRDFDKTVARVRNVFIDRFGAEAASEMISTAREEYERLIPQMPYIGGKQPLTQFIVSTAWFLAMYRALQKHGYTVADAGALVYRVSEIYINSYPAVVRQMLGHTTFSKRNLKGLRRRAVESHHSPYSDDYIFNFVEGDGVNFDFGVDYLRCASCQFLKAQGAPELAAWLCPIDILYSDSFGWGLRRTKTLAEGCDRCDFRFKKGGSTNVAVPAYWKV